MARRGDRPRGEGARALRLGLGREPARPGRPVPGARDRPLPRPDPFLAISAGYVIRRIAADSRKIDIGDAAERALDGDLLRAMGADLASIHVSGRVTAEAIRADLKARDKDWLREAAKALEASVEIDFRLWREARATDA